MAKDKPICVLVRRGDALVPAMNIDRMAIEAFGQGEEVQVEFKRKRNIKRLRAYWANLQECVDATECCASKEALDAYIRPAVGFIDMVHVKGQWVPVPRHINTSQCEEPEMIEFFKRVDERLAREFNFVSQRAA